MQLVHALRKPWKQSIREQSTNLNDLSVYDHHPIKRFILLINLIAWNYINISISGNYKKPTSQGYFQASFEYSTN